MSGSEQPGAAGGARSSPWPYTVLKLLAATAIFAMAALTFVDVIGRYVFNAPIPGTFEIVGLLLGVVTFAALPLVTRDRAHITVDLFDHLIKGGFRRVQQLVVLVASAAVIGFFAERLLATAVDEYRADYVTEYFGISRAPLLVVLSILSAVTCAILVVMIWRYLTGRLAMTQPVAGVDGGIAPPDKPTH